MNDTERKSGAKAHLWKPGQSGNPGGRPKAAITARAACRALNEETLDTLVSLMRNHPDGRVQAMCAIRIRDEANGKPVPMTEMPDDEHPQAEQLSDEQLLAMANEVLKSD